MRSCICLVVCLLVLGAILILPGCRKKQVAIQKEAEAAAQNEAAAQPQRNPVLPQRGQQLQSGGVVQKTLEATRRTVDLAQLKNFSLAYFQYQTTSGQGPARVEDIKDSLDRDMLEALKEGTIVAIWGLRNPSTDTIVAYTNYSDSSGTRIVATGGGGAQRISQQEFDAAMKTK